MIVAAARMREGVGTENYFTVRDEIVELSREGATQYLGAVSSVEPRLPPSPGPGLDPGSLPPFHFPGRGGHHNGSLYRPLRLWTQAQTGPRSQVLPRFGSHRHQHSGFGPRGPEIKIAITLTEILLDQETCKVPNLKSISHHQLREKNHL